MKKNLLLVGTLLAVVVGPALAEPPKEVRLDAPPVAAKVQPTALRPAGDGPFSRSIGIGRHILRAPFESEERVPAAEVSAVSARPAADGPFSRMIGKGTQTILRAPAFD